MRLLILGVSLVFGACTTRASKYPAPTPRYTGNCLSVVEAKRHIGEEAFCIWGEGEAFLPSDTTSRWNEDKRQRIRVATELLYPGEYDHTGAELSRQNGDRLRIILYTEEGVPGARSSLHGQSIEV